MEKKFKSQLELELNVRLSEIKSQEKPLVEFQIKTTMLSSKQEDIIQYALKYHGQFNGVCDIEFTNKQDFFTFCEYVFLVLNS